MGSQPPDGGLRWGGHLFGAPIRASDAPSNCRSTTVDATLAESDSVVEVDRSSRVGESVASSSDLLERRVLEAPSVYRTDVTRLLADEEVSWTFRDQLDDPNLVLSTSYIGHDRRRTGPGARLSRRTFRPRRSLLRIEVAVLVVAVLLGTLGVVRLLQAGQQPTGR